MPQTKESDLIVIWAEEIALSRRDLIGRAIRDAVKDHNPVFTEDLTCASRSEAGRVLIVLSDPVVSLARRLAAGERADTVLAAWQDWARVLLTEVTKARRRITMVEDEVFFDEAGSQLAVLARRCGLNGMTKLARPQPDPAPERLALVSAFGLLAVDGPAPPLVAELRALTLGGSRPVLDAGVIEAVLSEAMSLRMEKANEIARTQDLSDQLEKLKAEFQGIQSALQRELEGLAADRQRMVAAERALADAAAVLGLESAADFETRLSALGDLASERGAANDLLREAAVLNSRLLDDCQIALGGLRAKNAGLLDQLADRVLLQAENAALLRRVAITEARSDRRDAVFGAVLLRDQAKIEDLDTRLQALIAAKDAAAAALAETCGILMAHEALLGDRQARIDALEAELTRAYGLNS